MLGHEAVLLREAVDGLAIHPDGVYVDATFGRGGHTQAILSHLSDKGRVIAMDRDLEAVSHAKQSFAHDKRFSIVHSPFSQLQQVVLDAGCAGHVSGVLFDLGVSSPQLDDPSRGFSFMQSGPLDMRMDKAVKQTAAMFINEADEATLVSVFQTYGEERFARRIARAICAERQQAPIETTERLAEIVKAANPKWEKHKHPATRVFQAVRIEVNQELEELKQGLQGAVDVLGAGGRLVVISFHSLEDRVVKQFMKRQSEGEPLPKRIPIRYAEQAVFLKRVGRVVKPTMAEMTRNVRARSAVMRIGEKLA